MITALKASKFGNGTITIECATYPQREDVCRWLKKIRDKLPIQIVKISFTVGGYYNIEEFNTWVRAMKPKKDITESILGSKVDTTCQAKFL